MDLLHRKQMSATWFPYTAVERLWCQLGEMQRAGHSVDQCDRLKKLLHGALMSHLQQVGCATSECKLHYVACVGADCSSCSTSTFAGCGRLGGRAVVSWRWAGDGGPEQMKS